MHFLSVASLVVIFAGVASTTPVPASGKCVARTTLTSMVPSITAYGPVVTVASSQAISSPASIVPTCDSEKIYFDATRSATLIQCWMIACAPGQTPTSTALTLQQCHALENDARRNNYGQLPIGW
ncbi:hypothetical protein BASA50_004838 [Batrachochytrium salamandrivorans]|uniref:Ricin B lectin domain-containing protein n=1 Tax=Batrachochytrium salamandrivorans TaxID=1357716 RepID=A0ABQ8FEH2_9FUNG|nr:hypothetical protein BASA60_011378 [Batrachochytrium salamandrivorans]KAH6575567.1 hypothetical protein BASA62_001837 [Batrachochytrium salamandrivorans]KAH6580892.1 hypothetical protein BASA61_009347 [Batrachochytrium salamandrivorans]KAH6596904.1 hypothetical protein BASA50_004838 [Batrachochytrium salamandrivorans]KAH9244212.1 hypothetical protein BASA81_018392 [Batrachochytrium salamandrivorans]